MVTLPGEATVKGGAAGNTAFRGRRAQFGGIHGLEHPAERVRAKKVNAVAVRKAVYAVDCKWVNLI